MPKQALFWSDDHTKNAVFCFSFFRTYEVFMQDLVSGISFSLRREVAKHKEIKGDALAALKDWVNLILQVWLSMFSNRF